MTDLSIPGSTPARPGSGGAEGIDLSHRHASSSIDMRTGAITIEHKAVVKADAADIGSGSAVFTKVMSRSGTIETATLDTIVNGPSLPGNGMALRHALAAGFVSRDAAGNYVAGPGGPGDTAKSLADPKGDEADAKTEAEKADADKAERDKGDQGDGVALDEKIESHIDSLLENSSSDDQLAAIAQVAETGEVSAELITAAAEGAGVSPEAMTEQVGNVIAAFETQARDAITEATGMDSQVVIDWMKAEHMDALKAAEFAHATKRSTSGYTELAKVYVENLDTIDPDAILGATYPEGQSARRDGRGDIVVTGPDGVEYPWRSAVRAGFVSLKAG